METVVEVYSSIRTYLSIPLFTLGTTEVTIWSVLSLVIFLLLLVYLSGKLKFWITSKLLVRTSMRIGMRMAMGSIARYVVVLASLLIMLQSIGIDLTVFSVLAGALGVGIGFGLQHIADNFISGMILLIEGPIKIGDRIEVGDVEGDVTSIGARATTVVTNDNITIIIPNSSLTSQNVINWSHNNEEVRFAIPVAVGYDADVQLVERVLLEVAAKEEDVLDAPAPAVRFMAFGDSGLLFELRAWSSTLTHRKGVLTSKLNFAIHEAFKANGITIPYPQRVVHVKKE